MAQVATLGSGTVVGFQPATEGDAVTLEFALGIQRFWVQGLEQAGRPAKCMVTSVGITYVDDTGVKLGRGMQIVACPTMVNDAAARTIVLKRGARWGLVSSFRMSGPRFRLVTRLVEVDGALVRRLDEHEAEGENIDMPRILFEVLAATSRGTGVRPPWKRWSDAFTTSDELAALHCLRADGICWMIEEGVYADTAEAFDPLVSALGCDPAMARAAEVGRALVRAFRARGESEIALARQLRRLRELGVYLDDAD